MKIIETYYTTTTQIPDKNNQKRMARFENLGDALEHCDKVPFNVHTIKRVTVYETFWGKIEWKKEVLAS